MNEKIDSIKISLGQQINEKIEDVDKNIRQFINEQNQELRENIHVRMEQFNEVINQKMDGNTEERRQEITKTNERIEQINETIEQNRVNLCSKIDQVKEDSCVQIETIQREQVNLEKVQKQCGERCDNIDISKNKINDQVRQNQEEIELVRTRPTNINSIPTTESREGINFKNDRKNPMEFVARIDEHFNKYRITRWNSNREMLDECLDVYKRQQITNDDKFNK